MLDAALRIRTANQAFYRLFKLEKPDTEGRPIYEIGGGQWNVPQLKQLLEELLPKQAWIKDFELEQSYPGIGVRTMRVDAREIRQGDGERMILLTVNDVTELGQAAKTK